MATSLVVNFELTRTCNLQCRYCHVSRAHSCPQMSTEEMRTCIHWLCSGGRQVHAFLTGGEPLLHPLLKEWLSATQQHPSLTVSISTNGTLLTSDMVAELVSARIGMILVSIDGWDAESHDWHSRVEGSFNALLTGIKLLMGSALKDRVVTNTVLTHANVSQWPRIAELLLRLGIPRAKFSPVLMPLYVENYSDLRLTAEDLKEYRHIRPRLQGIRNESSERFEERMCDVLLDRNTQPIECFAGSRFIFVRADARVFPCWQMSDSVFRVRHTLERSDNDAKAPKLYTLSGDTELSASVTPFVRSNRHSICLDCCDACNLFLGTLYDSEAM